MGAGNYLGLRQTIPALLWMASLLLLVGPLCPMSASMLPNAQPARLWATLTLTICAWGAIVQSRSPLAIGRQAIDRMWLRFRDTFGLVWAMRVLERFNETARLKKWPFLLGLEGIQPVDRPDPPVPEPVFDQAALHEAETSLRWLLEKFVDEAWFERTQPNKAPQDTSLPT
jgi:hypothetical protein